MYPNYSIHGQSLRLVVPTATIEEWKSDPGRWTFRPCTDCFLFFSPPQLARRKVNFSFSLPLFDVSHDKNSEINWSLPMKIDFESLDGNYFPFALTVSNLKPEVRNLSQSRERYSDNKTHYREDLWIRDPTKYNSANFKAN